MAFLKDLYKNKVAKDLQKEFAYSSVMQIPKIEKVVINAGIGNAVADKKHLEANDFRINFNYRTKTCWNKN